MQVGHRLQFKCKSCDSDLFFSVLDSEATSEGISCSHCSSKLVFDEATQRQLRKFEALCREIQNAEEILGSTAVAVDVGPHHVRVPFRLLLTRLSSVLELELGDEKVDIAFRMEPIHDVEVAEIGG